MAAEYTASMDMISATQTSEQIMESEQSSSSSEYSNTSDMETVSSAENNSESQEEFTEVKGRKRGNSGGVSPSATGSKVPYSGAQSVDLNSGLTNGLTVTPNSGLKVYRIVTQDFTSELEVLALLHCKYPKLDCGRKQTSNRSVLLIPRTQKVCDILESLKELNLKKVSFEAMKEKSNVQTGVLHYVPSFLSEQAILSTDKVLSATRIFRWDPTTQQKIETEMVKFTYDGQLPARLKLGICGNFKVRPFVPNPTRCYKCQKFGHVATTCRSRAPKCRLCAGAHMTELCQTKRNTGEQIVMKCANCGEAHPASSGLCTKMRDITANKRKQATLKFKPAPLPSTNAWGKNIGDKMIVHKQNVVNTPPIGITAHKNVTSGLKRGPALQPLQGQQIPAKKSFADFFKNKTSELPAAFKATPNLTTAKSNGGSHLAGGSQPPPQVVTTTGSAVLHKEAPEKTSQQATNSPLESKGQHVETPTTDEEQLIELITNAVEMAKRDLDIIQSMCIKNIKLKNSKIKDYLLKQSENVTRNLADLRELM